MRVGFNWGLLAVAALCSGRVPFPIAVHSTRDHDRGKPNYAAALRFVRPGKTTKTNVVWEFGAPDSKGVERFGEWSEVVEDWVSYTSWRDLGGFGVALVPLVGAGRPFLIARECRRPSVLTIWFDEIGVVKHYEFSQGETECKLVSSPNHPQPRCPCG